MKDNLKNLYKDIMYSVANMSKCNRKKVGALIISPDEENILAYGWNGRPRKSTGCDCCEDSNNNTLSDVIHAEMNCIAKLARTGASAKGCSIFVTLSPCMTCSLLISQSGIKKVYYVEEYRITDGLDVLLANGVEVEKLEQ
jgi:dCMP deaminase